MNIKKSLKTHPIINLILSYGISEKTPENELRFIQLLNVSIVLFFLYSSACVVQGVFFDNTILALLQIPCFAGLLLAIITIKKGRYTIGITIVLSTLIIVFSSLQFIYGGHAQLHIWLLIPVMGACLAYPPSHSKLALVMGSVAIIALAGFEFLEIPQKILSPILNTPSGKAYNKLALGLAILGVAFVSRSLLLAAEAELIKERQRSENLLNHTLPKPISKRLKNSEETIADNIESCSVLFCDIVGFTELSGKLSASELVHILNELFTRFDKLCEKYEVEKIKTIGDAYMVAAGVPNPVDNHAQVLVSFAQDMIKQLNIFNQQLKQNLEIRIGIHSGPVVAGVIGKSKFSYDLWGDTVNIAARMESHGVTGKIQITEATRNLLGDEIESNARGSINIKGKGEMNTFLIKD